MGSLGGENIREWQLGGVMGTGAEGSSPQCAQTANLARSCASNTSGQTFPVVQ